tara:strand:+ start:50 stop:301 length:252 start_codon:yes stop_codon:yes gene_type:complete
MSKKTSQKKEKVTFEEAMAELESIVHKMETGNLPLEDSVTAYQRGTELVKYCALQLENIENQVKIIESEMLKSFENLNEEDSK